MTEGYTRVPNAYVDEHLADMSGAETKVLLAILRKTAGWQKESDAISLSQLEEMTGLSRHGVIAGLRGLLERGLIVRSYSAGSKTASYTCATPSTGAKSAPMDSAKSAPADDDQCKKCTDTGAKSAPILVQKVHPQKKKEKRKESARSSRALAHSRESANGKTRDYLDHVLDRMDGHDPVERIIRAWSLPPHLEAQCLAFARVFEVAPTRADKARWAKGAETLHELRCDEARLKAARDEARRANLICTWPGAVTNLQAIRSAQQEYELIYDEERGGYVRQSKRH